MSTISSPTSAIIPYRPLHSLSLSLTAVKTVKSLVALKCIEILFKVMSEMNYLPSLFAQIQPSIPLDVDPLFFVAIVIQKIVEKQSYKKMIADRIMDRILFHFRSPIPVSLLPKVSERASITLDLQSNRVKLLWQGRAFFYQVVERNVDDIYEATLIGSIEQHQYLFYHFFHALLIHSLYNQRDKMLIESNYSQAIPSFHEQLEFIDTTQIDVGGWDQDPGNIREAYYTNRRASIIEENAPGSLIAKALKAESKKKQLEGFKDLAKRNFQQREEIEKSFDQNRLFVVMGKGHTQYFLKSEFGTRIDETEYKLMLKSVHENLQYFRTKKFIILDAIHPDNPSSLAADRAHIHKMIQEKINSGEIDLSEEDDLYSNP